MKRWQVVRIISVLTAVALCVGCGDKKMRARIAALDDETLVEIQGNYPPSSKPAILIAQEIERRGLSISPKSEDPPPQAAAATEGGSDNQFRVSVIHRDGETPRVAVQVKAHWTQLGKASAAVVLSWTPSLDPSTATPVRIVKGDATANMLGQIGASLSGQLGIKGSIKVKTENGWTFDSMSWSNSVGKIGTCISGNMRRTGSTDPVGAQAVYNILSQWADNQDTLFLEPPKEYFKRPGKMCVYLMDDHKVIDSKTIRWAGLK